LQSALATLQTECQRLRSESSSLSAANSQLQSAVTGLRQTLEEVEENMLTMHHAMQKQVGPAFVIPYLFPA
jgi:uncharacterized protein YlxW (UPF0749 family)